MNIIEQTEALKDLPDQALIREMQMPTGMAAPIFITSELKRRQRIRDEFKRREAQNMPTVAEEVVMAAGVPQQGIMQMAKSMAPKTNMGQNTGVASMMPKQPTMGMSSGGVVKMQTAGEVLKQQRNPETRKETLGNTIIGNLSPAIIELSLNGAYGKDAQRKVAQAALAGELGLGVQREVLSKALAGEYGDEIKEGAKRAEGVLEQSGLRGFKPEGSQLAPTAATAETVVSPSRGFEPTSNQLAGPSPTAETVVSPSRGFVPTASQLAPIASMAETVKPEFKSGILKSGIRGFEPTSNQLAPTAANAETVFPPSMMTMPAMRDPAVIDPTTGQLYDVLGSMRQQAEQTRQAEAQAAFEQSRLTPDELMVPFNNSPDPADLTRFLASQKPRFQGGGVPGGSLPSENQRLIEEAAEMADYFKKENFMSSDRFNRTPEDKLKSPEEQFAELGATKQIIDGEEFFVTPIGNTYDSSGALVQGGKAIQAIQSAQIGGADFSTTPLGAIPFGSYDVDAQGNVIPESYKKAELDISNITTPDIIKKPTSNLASLLGVDEGSAPVTDVSPPIKKKSDGAGYFGDLLVGPSGLSQPPNLETGLVSTTIAGDPRIASGVVGETVKEDKKEDKAKEKPDTSDLKKEEKIEEEALELQEKSFDQPESTEELIKDLDKQDKTTTVNKAAEVVLAEVGKETLAAASGAQGPQAAAQAQQGFSDKQWLDIAALGMMISSGNPADLREASKLFIKLQEASRGRKSKEKIAAEDRASRERVANIRAKATQENTAARIRSATLNRDFKVLDSMEERLQELLVPGAGIVSIDGKVSTQNRDAFNTYTRQLEEVRKAIQNLGTFDLGPGSGQTEIAGSYNVTAGAS